MDVTREKTQRNGTTTHGMDPEVSQHYVSLQKNNRLEGRIIPTILIRSRRSSERQKLGEDLHEMQSAGMINLPRQAFGKF